MIRSKVTLDSQLLKWLHQVHNNLEARKQFQERMWKVLISLEESSSSSCRRRGSRNSTPKKGRSRTCSRSTTLTFPKSASTESLRGKRGSPSTAKTDRTTKYNGRKQFSPTSLQLPKITRSIRRGRYTAADRTGDPWCSLSPSQITRGVPLSSRVNYEDPRWTHSWTGSARRDWRKSGKKKNKRGLNQGKTEYRHQNSFTLPF